MSRHDEQAFQTDFAKYGEKDAQIVGVSVDSIDKVCAIGREFFSVSQRQGSELTVGVPGGD